jgi:hypothetical protein
MINHNNIETVVYEFGGCIAKKVLKSLSHPSIIIEWNGGNINGVYDHLLRSSSEIRELITIEADSVHFNFLTC